MNPPTYHITTIKELVEVATDENISALLTDLKNFIIFAKNPEHFDGTVDISCFQWVDDGKSDVILDCKIDDWSAEAKETLITNLSAGVVYDETKNEITTNLSTASTDKLIYKLPDNI